jgi:uncharacterized protein (TIGR00106 family)
MHVVANVEVTPIGVGVSIRKPVQRAHEILQEAGLRTQVHPSGTSVEGELDKVLDAVRKIHTSLHADGVPRLMVNVAFNSRTDKEPTLEHDSSL